MEKRKIYEILRRVDICPIISALRRTELTSKTHKLIDEFFPFINQCMEPIFRN